MIAPNYNENQKDVGICFQYDSRVLLRDYWLLNIRAFGVGAYERNIAENEIITDGIVGVKTIDDLPEDTPLVVLAPKNGYYIQGETALPDFAHPENVIYYFGTDNNHLTKEELGEREYQTIYIPMEKTGEPLWSPQAGSIVLYDRLLKQNYGDSR